MGEEPKRDRAISLLNSLHEKLTDNASTFPLIGYIIPDSIVAWECTYPEIFPMGNIIMQQYKHIGPARDNMEKAEAVDWLSNALALTDHAITYLKGLSDKEFESAGLHVFQSVTPAVPVLDFMDQYDDNTNKKLHLFLTKIAREGEQTSSIDCRFACAFCLRKILEEAVKKKILMKGGSIEDDNGNPKGLKSLINALKDDLGTRLYKEILSMKVLIEETIHQHHHPTIVELNIVTATIFGLIEKLEIFSKKNGDDGK